MGLSDGAFFMIKHTPLPNGNHPISSPIYPMGVADTLEHSLDAKKAHDIYYIILTLFCALFAAMLFCNSAEHLLHKNNPALSYFNLRFWETH